MAGRMVVPSVRNAQVPLAVLLVYLSFSCSSLQSQLWFSPGLFSGRMSVQAEFVYILGLLCLIGAGMFRV